MRYKLLWAQARTSAGRVAIFFVIYLIGVLIFAVAAVAGIGTGVLAAQSGRAETVAQALLGSLFLTGITVSLLMGVGPSAAFSDPILRRYPMNRHLRFAAQHLVGLLDPTWVLILGTLLGLAIGFQVMGVCSMLVGLPTVLVFLAASYLCAATLIMVVRKVLQFRSGPVILMVGGVLIFLTFILIGSSEISTEKLRPLAEILLGLTPAKAAAAVITSTSSVARLRAAVLLLGWVVLSSVALRLAQRLEPSGSVQQESNSEGESIYDIAARLFPAAMRPLIAKSLRYHLRCNRVRYSLLMTGPLLLFLTYMGYRSGADRGTLLITFMFIAGFFSTIAMSVNYFGWDSAGVRRYPLLPISLPAVLRAHSYASLTLGSLGALLTLMIGIAVMRVAMTWPTLIFLLFDAAAGLLLLHAAALWIAVLAPKRADFTTMMGNVVSLPAKILMIGAMVPLIVVNSGIGPSSERVVEQWRWMMLAAMLGLVIYAVSLKTVAPVLSQCRERLIEKMAGAASN